MSKTNKAGCILLDLEKKKIALVYREEQNDYSFPKGHLEDGETLIECAIRETAEETKRDCVVLCEVPIFCEEYITPKGEEVIVYYYISKDIGPSDNNSLETHPTIWVNIDEVYDKLTYLDSKEEWLKIKDKVQKYLYKNSEMI